MIDTFSTDFLVRHPNKGDLEAVYKLHEACDIAEYGTPDLTLDDLRSAWEAPTCKLETDAWMVVGPGHQLVGYVDVMHRQHVRTYAFVRVLNLAEEWAQQHSFGEFYRRGKEKVVLTVDSQNLTGATRLYEGAGMHVARTYISFEKELRAGIELSTQAFPST